MKWFIPKSHLLRYSLFQILFIFFTVSVFCQITWTGGGDVDDWNDPNNWSTNPGNGSNIEIDGSSVILSVTSSFNPADVQVLNGGSLTITTNGSLIATDDLTISGSGTKLAISGGLFSSGNSGSNADDNTLSTGAAIEVLSGSFRLFGDLIVNNGSMDIQGGTFDMNGNASSEDLILQNNATFTMSGGEFTNDRGITADGSIFNFSGGTINQNGGGNSDDVSFTGSTITINGTSPGGTFNNDQELFYNNSTVNFSVGTIQNTKTVYFQNGSQFIMSSSDSYIEIGTSGLPRYDLEIDGSTTNATINADALISLSGEVNVRNGATVDLYGTIDAVTLRDPNPGGDLVLYGTSTFDIEVGGVLNVEDIRFADDCEGSTLNVHGSLSSVDDIIFHETDDTNVRDDCTSPPDDESINVYGTMDIGDNIQGLDDSGATITVEDGATFTAGGWGSGEDVDRIWGDEIVTNGNGSATVNDVNLPVELLLFDVHFDGSKVVINWSTASELNNDFFEISKSINGEDFVAIGKVNGNGTTSNVNHYEFIDRNAFSSTNALFYSLRQEDFDGTSEMLSIKRIDVSTVENKLIVYPNPVMNGTLTISNVYATPATLQLLDMSGREMISSDLDHNTSIWEIDVSSIEQGLYVVRLTDDISGMELGTARITVSD